ncbi:hypothetical protein BHAMNSH16_07055 [Brachyspira hampsonii]|uniref:Tetratricopeptide repeat protein n=2 Tax=Brachyspira hampsonii TaxID=1287055 RepID=A0AAC9TV61_9SPIR|nr:hypothetical protein [Brachyspira hampsonii]ASJ21414.1 hypothetical protein BHAMNSH16_07055 [Brachyspira hampsonii]MBW5379390.1 hypothetical protein [Brachyspira hampsonii]MBW5411075.1 hypothetical protein [Brachyspira hampsonii]OEJ19671.1 hypothetical protein A9496_03430 [Brachyspira hampsonii]
MIKKIFIIFFTILTINSISFAQKKIIIFETEYSNNYNSYAVKDLIIKNLFVNSDFHIIPYMPYKKSDYKEIKSKIKELTLNNNADLSITYDLFKYKNGLVLNYVIFDREKPNEWKEKNIYSKEENLFESINKVLEDIYSYSKKNNNLITEDEYISLIGYYSQIINSNDKNKVYEMFFNFYKDNIYFNMDYLEYLTEKGNKNSINDMTAIIDNIKKYLDKNNHYYLSALGDLYYSRYKVNVENDDIEKSIENYNKAINTKKDNYIYYRKLADAYILKNDYDNASKCYNAAIEIYDKDINLIKDAVYLLKRDMNQNGNLVIGYLKKIIDINKNDDEALEELAGIYENLGDKYNSQIYYSKLLEAVNYNLYIINNEKPNPVLYDKYIKKRNEITKKLEKLQI